MLSKLLTLKIEYLKTKIYEFESTSPVNVQKLFIANIILYQFHSIFELIYKVEQAFGGHHNDSDKFWILLLLIKLHPDDRN